MKKPTILIVDDDRNVRTALRVRLSAWGFRVLESADGLGVLRVCPKGTANAIILDQEIPDGDGRSVAPMVRNESDIPTVFLSGDDRPEFQSMVTQLPDCCYLVKPPGGARMSQLLASIIEPPRVTNAVA